jgi:uncharacterized RDD family membrane protein YckC
MSEQYGGQWNNPSGGGPQPGPAPYGDLPHYGLTPQGGYGPAPSYPVNPQQPPYGAGYPAAPYYPPLRSDYTPWGRRVGAYLIDSAPMLVASIIFNVGYIMFIVSTVTSGRTTPDFSTGLMPMIVGAIIGLAALGWQIYNRWFVAGRTGQSLGKRVTNIRLISEETNAPIGPLNAFLRDLVHIVDGFAYVGYLWPLWDDKRQTFADKLMKTIVVQAPAGTPQPNSVPAAEGLSQG